MVRRPPSYCPYCGEELASTTFEERERAFCPDCESIVWQDAVPIAGVAVVDGDSLLLQKRAIPPGVGTWGLPGGILEYDEHPRDGAVRELSEETGVEVDPETLSLTETVTWGGDGGGYSLYVLFTVPAAETRGTPTAASEEVTDVRFWTPAGLAAADETVGELPGGDAPDPQAVYRRILAACETQD